MPKTHYETLKIEQDATADAIKIAYRTLAKQYHPDKAFKNGLAPEVAEKLFKDIGEAYETLNDPAKRGSYDLTLPRKVTAAGAGSSSYPSQRSSSRSSRGTWTLPSDTSREATQILSLLTKLAQYNEQAKHLFQKPDRIFDMYGIEYNIYFSIDVDTTEAQFIAIANWFERELVTYFSEQKETSRPTVIKAKYNKPIPDFIFAPEHKLNFWPGGDELIQALQAILLKKQMAAVSTSSSESRAPAASHDDSFKPLRWAHGYYYGHISTYPLHKFGEKPMVVQEPDSTTFHLRMYEKVLWTVKNYGTPKVSYEAAYFDDRRGMAITREIGKLELKDFNAAIIDFLSPKKASEGPIPSTKPIPQSKKSAGVERAPKPVIGSDLLKSELKSLAQLLDRKIAEKLKMAKDSGKKIIIAVGENHIGRKSLLVELLVLRLAKKYGINTLAEEADPKLLKYVRSKHITEDDPNFSFTLSIAERLGMSIVPVDKDSNASDLVRNTCMKNGLIKLNDHCVFHAGINHLYPVVMSSPEISSKYEILSINAMNLTAEEGHAFEPISRYQECLLKIHSDPTEFLQAEINAQLPSQSGFAMIPLAGQALLSLLPHDKDASHAIPAEEPHRTKKAGDRPATSGGKVKVVSIDFDSIAENIHEWKRRLDRIKRESNVSDVAGSIFFYKKAQAFDLQTFLGHLGIDAKLAEGISFRNYNSRCIFEFPETIDLEKLESLCNKLTEKGIGAWVVDAFKDSFATRGPRVQISKNREELESWMQEQEAHAKPRAQHYDNISI